jgi:hypothetical protein
MFCDSLRVVGAAPQRVEPLCDPSATVNWIKTTWKKAGA